MARNRPMVETEGTRMREVSTMEQFGNLIEFRQAVYDQGSTRAKDAQSADPGLS